MNIPSSIEFEKVLALIADFAGSRAAKDALLACVPAKDPKSVTQWLTELDEINLVLDAGFHVPIGGIREMRDLFGLLAKGEEKLSGEELLRVRADIETARSLRKALAEPRNIPMLREKLDALPDLEGIAASITRAISEQGEVRDDASQRLAGIRRDLVKSRQDIERRMSDYLASNNEIFQDNFFTIRNERYVLPVKASFQGQVQGIVHDQSGSGQTVFIEPLEYLGLNNRLARLKAEDREEVARILLALTEMLAASLTELRETFDILVFFDALYARARFARKYEGTRPEIVNRGRLELKGARHPLIHPDCVPLDLSMNSETSCVIITGPNGGGKTVAIKTLGVNILLMQTGNYVLARANSCIPVFDEVLVDIGEAQSIENHLSTFTSHIRRLNEILAAATPSSMVLIDEIGGGTDPIEGAALAIGVLRALTRRGAFSVVTSHYDTLKQAAFTNPGFMNAGMEFDYETLRPTFRFMQGIPGRSNALAISRMFGVPEEVLVEMSLLLEGKGGRETELLDGLERERARAEALRRSWEEKDRDISLRQAELDAGMKKLDQFRKSRRDELVETYEEKIREKIREIEKVIHQLKKNLTEGHVAQSELTDARNTLSDATKALSDLRCLPNPDRDSFESKRKTERISIGDTVNWGGMRTQGIVESIAADGRRAFVEFDGKSLNVDVKELCRAIVEKKKPLFPGALIAGGPLSHIPTTGCIPPKSHGWRQFSGVVRDQLDLRGLRVEEALERAESYLKEADANRIGKAYLIHGKGTGALQKAIHEFLKKSPYRKKFRFGRYGEGDLGVTVVVFDPGADAEVRDESRESADSRKSRHRK